MNSLAELFDINCNHTGWHTNSIEGPIWIYITNRLPRHKTIILQNTLSMIFGGNRRLDVVVRRIKNSAGG